LGAKACSFAFVFYVTRALGPALYGNFTAANAFVGIFAFLSDLGMSTVIVRDVAQDQTLATRYVSNAMVMKLLFALADIVLIAVVAQIIIAPSLRSAVLAAAFALAPLAVSSTLQLVFQFSERFAYGAVLNVATATLSALLRVLVLVMGHRVLGLMLANTGVTLLSTLVVAWIVYTRFLPRRLEIDLRFWPVLLRRAVPFMLLALLSTLYAGIDRQILYVLSGCGHLRGNAGCAPVGQYSAAYQILDVLTLVFATSANAAVVPMFTRVAAQSREALVRVVRSSVTLMLTFGVPVALFITCYAPEALHVLGGHKFVIAAPALAVLIWAFPCFLVLGMIGMALVALDRQAIITIAFVVTLIFNVVFNVLLIPHYSYMASSALTVASEIVNGVIMVAALRRLLGPLHLGAAVTKVGVITVVTAVVLWAVHGYSVVLGVPLATLIILAGLRLTRVMGPTEREILGRLPVIGRYAPLL
jgi:O-antigen/teichoic acid export membrane protein